MKKLFTLLAIVLTFQCMAQVDTSGMTWYENEYRNPDIENVDSIIAMMDSMFLPLEERSRWRSWRRLRHLVDTCPEGTTWDHGMLSSGCEVAAGCYTQEQQKENYEWFYKCRKEDEGSGGIIALKSLDDLIPETPITIEDIEKWIEYCKNNPIIWYPIKNPMNLNIVMDSTDIDYDNPIIDPKDPNDIVGLFKWLKDN